MSFKSFWRWLRPTLVLCSCIVVGAVAPSLSSAQPADRPAAMPQGQSDFDKFLRDFFADQNFGPNADSGRASRGEVSTTPGRSWLGVNVQAPNGDASSPEPATGALVASVVEGSPAAQAGVRGADVIVSLEGHTVHRPEELRDLVIALPPGSRVELVVIRAGRPLVLSAQLSVAPQQQQLGAGGLPNSARPPQAGQNERNALTMTPPGARERPIQPKTQSDAAGRFAITIPSDWQTTIAEMNDDLTGGFQAWSPAGETVYFYIGPIYFNREGALQALGLRQQLGQVLARESVAFVLRAAAPPLYPVDVVRRWLPQMAGAGVMSDLGIMESQDQGGNPPSAIVQYRFNKDWDRARGAAIFPIPVGTRGVVAMEGGALIVSDPTPFNFWNLIIFGAEAPAPAFRKNKELYAAVLGTLQISPQAMQTAQDNAAAPLLRKGQVDRIIAAPLNNAMHGDDKVYRQWMDALGGMTTLTAPSGTEGQVPSTEVGPGREKCFDAFGRLIDARSNFMKCREYPRQ